MNTMKTLTLALLLVAAAQACGGELQVAEGSDAPVTRLARRLPQTDPGFAAEAQPEPAD